MRNYLKEEYINSSPNNALMKNLYNNISTEEKELFNKLCKIPNIEKEGFSDLNFLLIDKFIDEIKDDKIKNNLFTLFFINYINYSVLFKKVYNLETTEVFNLIKNKYNLNNDYINLINMEIFSQKLGFEKTNKISNLFLQAVMKNQNLEQLDFIIKNFDNNEIKEYFNNINFNFRDIFIQNISSYKDFFNKLIELELINPNSINYKDYIYSNKDLDSKPTEYITKATILNTLCIYKPLSFLDKNVLDTFNFLYSEGYEINDSLKIDNYYKKLINNIDKAFENLNTNRDNLKEFIKKIPEIYNLIAKNKDLNLEEKSESIIKKNQEISKLIKEYNDIIKLGELKNTRLENIKLKLNKDKKYFENIREL